MSSETTIYVFLAVIIILTGFVFHLERKIKRILKGNSANDIEEALIQAYEEIDRLKKDTKQINGELRTVQEKIRENIKSAKTVRFNPFSDVGGKQSFATALLDDKGDGVVISSLYSREKVSTFGKPIMKYKSEYELTKEEKEAIKLVQGLL